MDSDTKVSICIACGCDDYHACAGDDGQPCHWLRLDRDAGLGVCSECPEVVADWDGGDRKFRVPVEREA